MSKEYYRKAKIDRAASHDRTIESLKRQIESARESLKRFQTLDFCHFGSRGEYGTHIDIVNV